MIINAHRGVHYKFPENSLESILETFKTNANGIELDVVSSKDGELFVMHDLFLNPKLHMHPSLNIKQKKKIFAAQLESTSLSETILLSSNGGIYKIPTLEKVIKSISKHLIDEINHCKKLFIEVKSLPAASCATGDFNEILPKIHNILREYSIENKSTIISFDYRVIQISKSISPTVRTGLVTARALVDYSKLLVSTGVDFLVCNKDWINSEEVEKIKQADKEVYLWTSNSIEDWENAKSIGVDGIMTDDVIGAAEFFN